MVGREEILTGSARWLTGSALSKGRRASRVETVHGSESIPAIRVILGLREWETNRVGHHDRSGNVVREWSELGWHPNEGVKRMRCGKGSGLQDVTDLLWFAVKYNLKNT